MQDVNCIKLVLVEKETKISLFQNLCHDMA